jgi:hypothetical protein
VSETVADACARGVVGGVFGDKAFLDFTGTSPAILTDEDSKIAVNAFKNLARELRLHGAPRGPDVPRADGTLLDGRRTRTGSTTTISTARS